jgi:putative hydrolase of the HAD superfamily
MNRVDIAAVVFDFFGTLTPGRSPQAQAAARVEQARALGVDAAAFDAALNDSYRERFRGETGDVEQSLALLARRLGFRPSKSARAAAARIRLAAERRFGEPRAEAVALLQALRQRGLQVGLISDCSAELPIYFAELAIAPLVDAAVFSCLTGTLKPDPHLPDLLSAARRASRGQLVRRGRWQQRAARRQGGGHASGHLDVAVERGDVVYGRHGGLDGDMIESLLELLPLIDSHPERP